MSPGAYRVLRDQLVEVIASVRSQATQVEAVAHLGETPPIIRAQGAWTSSDAPQHACHDGTITSGNTGT